MALEAVVWSCLGALSWIGFVPSAARRNPAIVRSTQTNRFLLLWFLPGLAFSAFFHVGDPDQTLEIVPATCLLGAYVLSAFRGSPLRVRTAVISVALFLNLFLFFKPISKIAKASTYTPVRWMDGYIGGLIDGASRVRGAHGLTVVFPSGIPGWRNLSYYAPAVQVLVVADEDRRPVTVFRIQARHSEGLTAPPDAIPIPSCGLVALADPGMPSWDTPGAPAGLVRDGNLWLFRAAPGIAFRSHDLRFVSADSPCPPVR